MNYVLFFQISEANWKMSSSDSEDDDRSQTASEDSLDSKTSSASGGGEKANGTNDPAERNGEQGWTLLGRWTILFNQIMFEMFFRTFFKCSED